MEKCPGVSSGLAGKAESCKGCPNAKICSEAKPDPDISIIKDNLTPIKLIIAVLSGKGGVGKSTISRNIASSISEKGLNTMILDFDLSGPSIPRLTNTQAQTIYEHSGRIEPIKIGENLFVMSISHLEGVDNVSRVFDSGTKNFAIKKILKTCRFENIDVLVIDTPPNITEEHLSLVNYIKPDYSVIVSTPQKLSLDDVIRQISFCKKVNIKILGMVENMKHFTCGKCNTIIDVFNDCGIEEYCNKEGISYLGSIQLNSNIARQSDYGLSVKDEAFENIAEKIAKILETNKI